MSPSEDTDTLPSLPSLPAPTTPALASEAVAATLPTTGATAPRLALPDLPATSSLMLDGELPRLGSVAPPTPSTDVEPAVPAPEAPMVETPAAATSDDPVHPMAHLMPERPAPTEAALKAAQLRAAKKARAKKIKIGVAIGVLAVAAIAGPPLFRWVSDAINEAGGTSTEQPAD